MTGRSETGGERIARAFRDARARGRGALIPYLCAGDPDRATCGRMLAAAVRAGADIIELGIPYGDPLADGPTIAAAAQRALEGGTTIHDALALATELASSDPTPILLFTYFNPILQFGLDRFAAAVAAAGACGAIVPDLPLEETVAIRKAFAPLGLALPLLVAPTTPAARASTIARASDGFTYLVSRLGVTSAHSEPDFLWLAQRVAALRAVTERPLAIGFGISTATHVRRAFEIADGAIVGSALIDAYAGYAGDEAVARVSRFLEGILPAPVP